MVMDISGVLRYTLQVPHYPNILALYFTGVRITLGHAVAQFVELLLYEPEGRGFVSRCCYRNFWLTHSFLPHYGPGVDSTSNRNEYQEYFLGG